MLEWYAAQSYADRKPQLVEARDKQVVIHCAGGGRSLLAAQTLQRLGFKNVRSMAGGFNAWSAKGLPVEKQERSRAFPGGFRVAREGTA